MCLDLAPKQEIAATQGFFEAPIKPLAFLAEWKHPRSYALPMFDPVRASGERFHAYPADPADRTFSDA